ncbi:endoribonuclease YbeY [Scleropages formosus]|uniref:YbeY metalloendoribonuclease n=1 Tax=Scleropages formosus TaxID=113540 RepID=A0A8C9S2S5_SCLFO|nr:endoribonuclease YbeY [Scleropages formosus]
MSLVVRNLQRAVPLRRARLRRDVELLRRIAGIERFDLGLACVDNRRMQRLNAAYRRTDEPTDVLSFPFYEGPRLEAGKLSSMSRELPRDELNLGDVVLGVQYIMDMVMAPCVESSREDFYGALTVITLHGICHLLGYRHDTHEQWTEMFQKEKYILSEFNRLTGGQLEPLTGRDAS